MSTIPGWSLRYAALVKAEIERNTSDEYAADSLHTCHTRIVADKFNLWAFYHDVDGGVAVSAEGELYYFFDVDWSLQKLHERDEWFSMAWVILSRQEEFRALAPQRPRDAEICGACGGKGYIDTVSLGCGQCLLLGWRRAAK